MDEQLLIRFLTHTCTPENMRSVEKWIEAGKSNADWLFEMERIWSLKDELRFSDKKEIEDAYSRFISGLQDTGTEKKVCRSIAFPSWIKYAVAIILIGLLGTNLYFLLDKDTDLTNMVEVPRGQRMALTLSDGTKVWLNSNSKFIYPTQFSSKERDVRLEGEGFFEVAHNPKSPFTVHVDLLRIKVLGTKFNVKAYKEETSSVTLAEGKVEVITDDDGQKVTMKPNQQVSYSKEYGLAVNKDINTDVVKSWILGEAAYQNKRLDEIIHDLERKFDVHIDIRDRELSSEIFTCRFKESATIDQVLTLLKETRKLDYKIRGTQIQIYKPLK